MNRFRAISLFVTLAFTVEMVRADTLYAVGLPLHSNSTCLYRIDGYRDAPVATYVGDLGVQALDIAIHPETGVGYITGLSSGSGLSLYSVDLATAQTTLVGLIDVGAPGFIAINAMDFDAAGTLYLWGDVYLSTIDLSNAQLTAVATTSPFACDGAIAFRPDGVLVGNAFPSQLVEFELGRDGATLIGPMGIPDVYGMEIDSDGFAIAGQGEAHQGTAVLHSINLATGATTFIGPVAGAEEFGMGGLAFLRSATTPVIGDLNGDGKVDSADLALLLGAWGCAPAGEGSDADLDADGCVDAADLSILLGNWTQP